MGYGSKNCWKSVIVDRDLLAHKNRVSTTLHIKERDTFVELPNKLIRNSNHLDSWAVLVLNASMDVYTYTVEQNKVIKKYISYDEFKELLGGHIHEIKR